MIRCGLDRLLEDPARLRGRRYALLGHAASVSAGLRPAAVALREVGAAPRLLFGPEHGFHGVEQDMVPSADARDPWTGLPIHSLYGDSSSSLRPDPAAFAGLDLLLVDLQDVGARYYTYAATAVWAAAAARRAGCEVWILDRPNPLGGVVVEGNLRRPGYESFVGAFELPVRHGLTLGELVRLEASSSGWGEEVRVVAAEGWRRSLEWESVGRPWLAPSPNLPTLEAVRVYPGACLLEATNLSEGRGTSRPFLLSGAPGLDGAALAGRLEEAGLEGVRFLPVFFRPQAGKHAGRVCGGVRWVVLDPARFRPYRAGVELVRAASRLWEGFAWRSEPYEFESERTAVDLLTGDSTLREAVDRGDDPTPWIESWAADEEAFRTRRRAALIYPEEEE